MLNSSCVLLLLVAMSGLLLAREVDSMKSGRLPLSRQQLADNRCNQAAEIANGQTTFKLLRLKEQAIEPAADNYEDDENDTEDESFQPDKVVIVKDNDPASGSDQVEAEAELFLLNEDDSDEDDNVEDDERSKKRPWRKIKRILRRQLIKKPKRYIKKLVHKIGLKRQLRASPSMLRSTLIALFPLQPDDCEVQEVGVLMQGEEEGEEHIAATANGRFSEKQLFVLRKAPAPTAHASSIINGQQ